MKGGMMVCARRGSMLVLLLGSQVASVSREIFSLAIEPKFGSVDGGLFPKFDSNTLGPGRHSCGRVLGARRQALLLASFSHTDAPTP